MSQILIGPASVFCLTKGRNSSLDLEGQSQIKNGRLFPQVGVVRVGEVVRQLVASVAEQFSPTTRNQSSDN